MKCISIALLAAGLAVVAERAPDAGVWGTWVKNCQAVPPQVKGTGVVVQWSDVEQTQGTFNWSTADAARSNTCGRPFASFQVNSITHPVWMQHALPTATSWQDPEDEDARYVMYYHPDFVSHMKRMVNSSAAYLRQPPSGPGIAATAVVRMNWDAIGTEHFEVPKQYWPASAWSTPAGVSPGPDFEPDATQQAFQEAVFPSYSTAFTVPGTPRLFVRNNLALNSVLFNKYRSLFENGTLSWFDTSSEPEPHEAEEAQRFLVFLRWCRTGITTCYAEPWTSAFSDRASDPTDFPPPAWVWWRVLSDLHLGVSRIAMYGDDLEVAAAGTYQGQPVDPAYQAEFQAAVRLADRYAGFHADPASSPGAFVAFRHSVRQLGGDYQNVTDYSVLAQLSNASSAQLPWLDARANGTAVPLPAPVSHTVHAIGNATQRFGAWARLLVAGVPAKVQLDTALAARLNGAGSELKLCVTLLNRCSFSTTDSAGVRGGAAPLGSANCSVTFVAGNTKPQHVQLPLGGAGAGNDDWVTIERYITPPLQNGTVQVELDGTDSDASVAVHMIELLADASAKCSAATTL